MNVLYVLRALPGAGKSTLALALAGGNEEAICCTDDFPTLYTFSDDGLVATFNGMEPDEEHGVRIVAAHQWNQQNASHLMEIGVEKVVVANTNTERWEFQFYLDLAEEFGYRVTVISLFDGGCTDDELVGRNAHGVPLHAIQRMRERFQHNWKDAPKTR